VPFFRSTLVVPKFFFNPRRAENRGAAGASDPLGGVTFLPAWPRAPRMKGRWIE